MSGGVSTWRASTERLKLGAYSSRSAKHRSAKASPIRSQPGPRSVYGAYCTKMDIRCRPGGATVGSTTEGIVHSSTGRSDGRPYFASSYARSM